MYTELSQLKYVIDKKPEIIIDTFKEFDLSKIDITRFHTWSEYELYLGIYRGNKKNFKSELDAFLKLWLAELIELEEWYDQYNNREDKYQFAKDKFNFRFLEESKEFNIKLWDIASAEHYINNSISYKIKQTISGKKFYEERYNLKNDRGGPGIYKADLQMIDEKNFSLIINSINKAQQIKYDNYYAGYYMIFVETNEDYILYSD